MQVVVLGECMVELAPQGGDSYRLGYAGDTFNTAVYMARLGLEVAYATVLGEGDPFTETIRATMRREGIDERLVFATPGRLPGLYLINVDAQGERRFFYWRDQAPVREIVATHGPELRAGLLASDCLFLSGITLAVIGEVGRATLANWLAEARQKGVTIAFDPNYRPALWPDTATARAAFERVFRLCQFVSLSAEDVAALYQVPPDALAESLAANGTETVLRTSDLVSVVYTRKGRESYPVHTPVRPVDTTGAGDAYNATYFGSRLSGLAPAEAVARAQSLSAAVVAQPGAIIASTSMPEDVTLRS